MMKLLIISNSKDITSDIIVKRLSERNIDFYRLNTDELFISVECEFDFKHNSFLLYDKRSDLVIDLKGISAVYFRRPELPKIKYNVDTEGEQEFIKNEIAYLIEGIYKIINQANWINPVFSIREAENKIYQLEIAQQIGFIIPPSIIVSQGNVVNEFAKTYEDICIKPIKSGLLPSIADSEEKVIFTSKLNVEDIEDIDRFNGYPHYLQQLISKTGDIRVIVVGNKVFATLIDSQSDENANVDWRRSENPLDHSKFTLPTDIERKCIRITKELGLKYSAIDLVLDKFGNYYFLEINPNGQWGWIENRVSYNISDAIIDYLLLEMPKSCPAWWAKTKKVLGKIRDIFIPVLEKTPKRSIEEIQKICENKVANDMYNLADDNLERCLDFATQTYDKEEDRRKNAESKSTVLISSLGLTITILVSVLFALLKNYESPNKCIEKILLIFTISLFSILVLYLCVTTFYAVKSIERKSYCSLDSKDILKSGSTSHYIKELAKTVLTYAEFNHQITNKKMNCMIMAHEYFKRAIITVGLLAIIILVSLLLT